MFTFSAVVLYASTSFSLTFLKSGRHFETVAIAILSHQMHVKLQIFNDVSVKIKE